MKAIGIDLGTTNSLVAVVTHGTPKVLPDVEGRALLPSAVYSGADRSLVGYDALAQAAAHPTDTLLSVKRFMGRTVAEAEAQGMGTYTFEADGSALRIVTAGGNFTPVEVSAFIMRTLRDRARGALDEGLVLGQHQTPAVITVPAYFDDAQRHATRFAGELAGLKVLRLLNEPTAAALAYGLEKRKEGRFAIFDLGGGTFDLSILNLVDGVFEVLSTGGDSQLGGDDFDRAVAASMLEAAGVTVEAADAGLRRRALLAASAAKIELTTHFTVEYRLEMADGHIFTSAFSREDFERLMRPVLQRVVAPCKQALRDAGLRVDELDGVVLVGGSTRSPFVQRFVGELFKQKPLIDLDPDQVVALGAAVQADLLSGDSELRETEAGDVLLLDVTPLSLGLETMGGVVEKVIPRCSQIPSSRSQEFTTFQDGQTGMDIHVLQGERELVEDCRSLARFRLMGIPPKGAGAARIKVTFQVDADGLLRVSAEELTTGVRQTVQVEPSHGLNDAQVEAMLTDALAHAEEDISARLLRSARMEAERVLMPLTRALREDAHLLEGDEAEMIQAAMADLHEAIKGDDHHPIEDLSLLLDKVSGGFAHRRMEHALQDGLRDVSVSELEDEMIDAPTGGCKKETLH